MFWNILKPGSLAQQKKLYQLVHENKMEGDPEKVIFNFFKYELYDAEKKLLAKGLSFYLVLKQRNYVDYLVHFDLFYRNIRNLEILSE